jgi:hypothetical protein
MLPNRAGASRHARQSGDQTPRAKTFLAPKQQILPGCVLQSGEGLLSKGMSNFLRLLDLHPEDVPRLREFVRA